MAKYINGGPGRERDGQPVLTINVNIGSDAPDPEAFIELLNRILEYGKESDIEELQELVDFFE